MLIAVFVFIFLIFIVSVRAISQIDFVSPTPDNNAQTCNRDLEIKTNITTINLPSKIKLNLNNLSYTYNTYNLTLMYNFDNLSSLGENDTYVVDIAGGNYNASVANGTWNATGRYNGAFEFNGSTYIKTGFNGTDIFNNFTISFWEKTTASGYSFFMGAGEAGQYYIYIRAQVDAINRLEFLVGNPTGGIGARYDSSLWRNGRWHQLTFVKRGNTVDGLYIYMDGSELSITRPFNTTLSSHAMGQDFYIGARNFAGIAYNFMNASMDEIRIYNRSLNSTEIMQNYLVNLNEYNTNQWSFYTNAYDLILGNNSFSVIASNSSEVENQTETRNITLLAITTRYYDNRKAAVTITADDFPAGIYTDRTFASIDYAQKNRIVISPGIITNDTDSSAWSSLQTEIDQGYVFPASHSVNHPHAVGSNTTLQVCDSKTTIIGNLTLPWQDWFNGSEYLVGWIEPYGETSASQRQNLSLCNYLNDRSVSEAGTVFASWDTTYGLYDRYGAKVYGRVTSTLDSLNNNFSVSYNNNGIYNLWIHPWEHSWTDSDTLPQHFSYIGNRTDIWYAGWGELYMYHYLENQSKPTINVTTYNNEQIIARINASEADRNRYGLSYPLTYEFYLPELWQYAFAFYNDTSTENYTAMTEKTSNDYWNGIDAYRQNTIERSIFISKSLPQNYSQFYLKIVPILSTKFDGLSTDLTTNLTAMNITNMTNFVLENTSYGKINFSESVNLSAGANLDRDVIISYKYASINTTNVPSLNEQATLTFYNLDFEDPVILRDGALCPSAVCQQMNYSGGNFTFNVTGFSTYTINCTAQWSCTEWSSCSGGDQTRTCDAGSCGTIISKPAERQDCYSGKLKPKNATGQNLTEQNLTNEEGLKTQPQLIPIYVFAIAIIGAAILAGYLILIKRIGKKRRRLK